MTTNSSPFIRKAIAGDERGIHEAHMRSIREVCSKVHTAEEISGWGNRPFSDKWTPLVQDGALWVVEFENQIHGVAYIKITLEATKIAAHIFGLYLTPEVIGKGLGANLMKLMLDVAKNAGAKLITLDSSLNAHNFYEAFGFRDTGPMKFSEIGGSSVRGYPMALVVSD